MAWCVLSAMLLALCTHAALRRVCRVVDRVFPPSDSDEWCVQSCSVLTTFVFHDCAAAQPWARGDACRQLCGSWRRAAEPKQHRTGCDALGVVSDVIRFRACGAGAARQPGLAARADAAAGDAGELRVPRHGATLIFDALTGVAALLLLAQGQSQPSWLCCQAAPWVLGLSSPCFLAL